MNKKLAFIALFTTLLVGCTAIQKYNAPTTSKAYIMPTCCNNCQSGACASLTNACSSTNNVTYDRYKNASYNYYGPNPPTYTNYYYSYEN
jgi:hypothetical protein